MCGPGYHTMTWGGWTTAPESDPPNLRCDCGMVNRRDFLAYDSDLKAERARADHLEAENAALREAGDELARWLWEWAKDHPEACYSHAALEAWRALAPGG